MVFALNYPAAKQWMLVVESLPPQRMWAVKGAAAAPIVGLLWWWYTSVFAQEKPDYNASNAYFGCVPLLGYVFLRNLTPGLRSHYAHSLHELGKVTLGQWFLLRLAFFFFLKMYCASRVNFLEPLIKS